MKCLPALFVFTEGLSALYMEWICPLSPVAAYCRFLVIFDIFRDTKKKLLISCLVKKITSIVLSASRFWLLSSTWNTLRSGTVPFFKVEFMFLNVSLLYVSINTLRDLSNNKIQRLPEDVFGNLTRMKRL